MTFEPSDEYIFNKNHHIHHFLQCTELNEYLTGYLYMTLYPMMKIVNFIQ